jgi:MFS transporter, ENTS family, enterobactin (siderophore) exporter
MPDAPAATPETPAAITKTRMSADAIEAPEAPVEARPLPLAENRDFKVLLGSQAVSALGDAVSFTALPLLVLALTGSGFAMGVVGAVQTLPDLIFGTLAGAMADRSDRKRMMFLADAGRAVLTALIPISVAVGGPTMAVIIVVAAPMSILRSFFLAGYTASIPALVGRSQIGRANSIFEALYSLGFIVGPAIAGLLAATIGPGPALAIDAASFGISALGLALVRTDLRAPVDRDRPPILSAIREGIDYILASPVLRTIILLWSTVSILIAPLVTALAVRITRDLGEPSSTLGVLLATYGVGTVAGSLISARIINHVRPGIVMLIGNVTLGAALILVALESTIPILLATALVAGVAQSMTLVTYITLRTAYSPDEFLGRIGSTARTVSLGLQPIGLLVGGALIDVIGGSTTMALMGATIALVTLAFVPVRALRGATLLPR